MVCECVCVCLSVGTVENLLDKEQEVTILI